MSLRPGGLALLLSTASLGAAAATPTAAPNAYPLVSTSVAGRPTTARQLVPEAATPAPQRALAESRIVYLNRDGAFVKPGSINDARANLSTIASQPTTLPPWTAEQPLWEDTVTCLRTMFAPFALRLVTVDPGEVPHLEAIFGGHSSQLGLPRGIVGISPFTSSCAVIENSIVYVFAEDVAANAQVVCEIMAQEIAHSYGLDHELLAGDPMTYLSYAGKRHFLDEEAACGETSARPCGINGSTCRETQNSVQLLRERLGVADPVPPSGRFVAPGDGEIVAPDFEIDVAAADNIAVAKVEFFVDDVSVGERRSAPYRLTARKVAAGEHTLTVEVTDQAQNQLREQRTIIVDPDATRGLLQACAAGGSRSSAPWPLLGALAVLAIRRRRRR